MTADSEKSAVNSSRSAVQTKRSESGQDDAIGEFVTQIANDIQVTDPTEQLFIFMVIKSLMSSSESDSWTIILQTMLLRLVASFVSHKVAAWTIASCHVLPELLGH